MLAALAGFAVMLGYSIDPGRCKRWCFLEDAFEMLLPASVRPFASGCVYLAFAALFWAWSRSYRSIPPPEP